MRDWCVSCDPSCLPVTAGQAQAPLCWMDEGQSEETVILPETCVSLHPGKRIDATVVTHFHLLPPLQLVNSSCRPSELKGLQ